jgi:NAD(P)H-flavin reductase
MSRPARERFSLDVERPLLVGGGIGIAPFPYLSERLGRPPAVLGFRSRAHAEARRSSRTRRWCRAAARHGGGPPGHDVLRAAGADAAAVARARARRQLAWEAPMACGYGACYGCAVEIDGELRRLCVDGPVLERAA